MGMTHGDTKTYPRVADVIGFVTPDQVLQVSEEIVKVQRDHGDRTNRKHARLKYTIDDRGVEWFVEELESRLGWKMAEPRPVFFERNGDQYGWLQGVDGKWYLTLFIQGGRVLDTDDYPMMTGLREIAKIHKGDFRLTGNQNVMIGGIAGEAHIAKHHGRDVESIFGELRWAGHNIIRERVETYGIDCDQLHGLRGVSHLRTGHGRGGTVSPPASRQTGCGDEACRARARAHRNPDDGLPQRLCPSVPG